MKGSCSLISVGNKVDLGSSKLSSKNRGGRYGFKFAMVAVGSGDSSSNIVAPFCNPFCSCSCYLVL